MTPEQLDTLAALPRDQLATLWGRLTGPEREHVERAVLRKLSERDPLGHLAWRDWNRTVAPRFFSGPYAPHHVEFWEWVEQIERGRRPRPHLSLWPRGHAKSTAAEVAVLKLGAKKLRSYAIYVSASQDQADDHVGNIGALMESPEVALHYPALAKKQMGKHGTAKGWRRNRLWTAHGLIVDALGLDAAVRGAKLESQRPDMLILDDIDATHATNRMVARKLRTISQDLMPAITPDAVIILAQNYVAPNAIAPMIGDRRTDILSGSIVSGPFPAVEGLEAELVPDPELDGEPVWTITAGRATWDGMDIGKCQEQIRVMGIVAFTIECQQDVAERPGSLWTQRIDDGSDKAFIHHDVAPDDVPELDTVVVGIDPNKTGRSDDAGVVVVGRGYPRTAGDGTPIGQPHAYILADGSGQAKPSEWRDTAARLLLDHGAARFVVEATGLGEHAELTLMGSPVLEESGFPASVHPVEAQLGKKDRARPVAQLYKDGRVHHVRSFPYLEQQMTTWEPDVDNVSPGGVDALVHAVTHLLIDRTGAPHIAVSDWHGGTANMA